jgi:hypothetical protein
MVALLYSDGTGAIGAAWISSLVGLLIVIGEIVGGLAAKSIMHIKWQLVVSMFLGGVFFASKKIECLKEGVSQLTYT